MLDTSNEWKQLIREPRQFYTGAQITLTNQTVLNLNNANIRGMKIDDSVSQSGKFTIGSAIINKLTLIIDNTEGQYSQHDFTGAVIRPSIGLQLSETIETLNKGVYTVDTATSSGATILITALDNMYLFDTDYSASALNYPATILQIMQDICTRHGVFFNSSAFTNSSFVVDERPDDEALTDREMTSYCAQIAGCQARHDNTGALEFVWYDMGAFEQSDNLDGGKFDSATPYASGDNADGGNFTDYNSGDNYDGGTFLQMERYHHIYSLKDVDIAVDDAVITGVRVTDSSEEPSTKTFGAEGYEIAIEDNPLIQDGAKAQEVANTVGAKIVGMRFRPMTISAVSDPSREAGDVALVSDRKGNSYQVLLTHISQTVGSMDTIRCDAETPSRNSSKRYSVSTKTYIKARNTAEKQISVYDIAVQQLTNLMVNSFGAFKSEEVLEDGSTIYYMHNKPTRAESQTIWKMTADAFAVSTDGGQTYNAGIDSQGNAVLNVLSAIGINAEWIKVVSNFSVGNNFNVNSQGILSATNAVLSGQITANSGQIGPFTISNQGLKSAVIELFEDNNYPLIWLTKYGENGAILERANYEPSSFRLFSENDGEYVEMGMMARDDGQGTKGQLSMNKVYSNGVGAFKLTDEGFDFFKVENGDYTGVSLSGGALIMSKGDYSASISMGSDGSVYIGGAKIYIDASEVIINGHVF